MTKSRWGPSSGSWVVLSVLVVAACGGKDRDGNPGTPEGTAQIGIGRPHDAAWVTQLGGSGDDEAFTMTASGGLLVGGQTASAWFGPFSDSCSATGEHAGEDCADAFLYDFARTKGVQFGQGQTDSLRGVAADTSSIYIAGKSREDASRNYQNDGWVMKYRADLTAREWGAHIRNAGKVDEMLALAALGDGIFVAGGSAAQLEPTQPTAGKEDSFVMRLSTAGATVLVDQFGSTEFEEMMMGITADATAVYAVGQTGGYLDDKAGGQNQGSTDALLIIRDLTLDPAAEICRIQFGTDRKDVAQAVAVAQDGIYVAGWTEGTINGRLPEGATCNQDDVGGDKVRADAFVAKYDRNCQHLWSRQFGTPGGDLVEAVATDGTNVYVVGDYGGGLDHSDAVVPTSGFLRVYSAAGELVNEILFDSGSDKADVARAVAVDGTFVYVSGGSEGAMGPPGSELGGLDVFVAKVPLADARATVTTDGTGCP